MLGKHGGWLAALALTLGLLAPAPAWAGTLLGWRQDPDCPPSEYRLRHYWAPALDYLHARCHPSNLDQYPPGPCPAVAPGYQMNRYRCPTLAPMPTAPYADPAGYFGRTGLPEASTPALPRADSPGQVPMSYEGLPDHP